MVMCVRHPYPDGRNRRAMNKRSPLLIAAAVLVCSVIVIPPDVVAQAAQSAQRAGQVSRMIPQVRIVRGTQRITGAPNSPVDWGDLIDTQRYGRARVALDDGSLINVGSDSSLKITQYNPAAQQSEMDLAYGRMRAKVAKITRPNGKFEVHTPVGVAGVVGTDFYIGYQGGLMQLVVFEGRVRFCNLAGVCVIVSGGMISTIRGNNLAPDPPAQVTPTELSDAGSSTEVVESAGVVAATHHLSLLAKIGLVSLVVVPAIVIPVLATHKPPACNPNLDVFQPGCTGTAF
jgi:hypothetical protein